MKIKYLIFLFLVFLPTLAEGKTQGVPQSLTQEADVEQVAVREGEKVIDLLTKEEKKNSASASIKSEQLKEEVKNNSGEVLEVKNESSLSEKTISPQEIKNSVNPSLDTLEKEAAAGVLGVKKESEANLLAGLLDEKKQESILDSKPEAASLPWLKFVLSTVFVCCSLVLVMYLFQTKVKKVALGQHKNEQPLKLVQSLSLGLKKDLHLVHLENTRFLFSSNGNDLQLMHSSNIGTTQQESSAPQLPFKQTVITNQKNPPLVSEQRIQENVADKIRRAVRELKPLHAQNSQSFINALNESSPLPQTKTLSAILNAAQVGSTPKNG